MTDKQKASNESPLCWVRPVTTVPDLGGFQVCREGEGIPVWGHPNGMYAPVSAEPVAYLDIGEGGYMDLGTDLTDDQLELLPKGRHMLAVIGTHGVHGYTTAPVASQSQQEKMKELEREVSGLRAARIAYASEFPPNAYGEPDVGNIHANIRKLKAQAQPLLSRNSGKLPPPDVETSSDAESTYSTGLVKQIAHDEYTRGYSKGWDHGNEYAQSQQPVSGADGLPVELSGVAQEIAGGSGFWRSCSGCHELNEGHDTGPQSKVFQCALGNGCSECGGIGAIWDTTDYDAMADFMAAESQQRTENTEPVGQDQFRDAAQMIEPSGNSGELPSDDWLTGCVGVQNQGGLHQITGLADIRRFAECVLKHWGKQDADRVDAERYRWLRDPKNDVALVLDKRTGYVPEDEQIPGVGGYHAYEYRAGVELDAAIDAARKEQE